MKLKFGDYNLGIWGTTMRPVGDRTGALHPRFYFSDLGKFIRLKIAQIGKNRSKFLRQNLIAHFRANNN
jgi:hypothetical protein